MTEETAGIRTQTKSVSKHSLSGWDVVLLRLDDFFRATLKELSVWKVDGMFW